MARILYAAAGDGYGHAVRAHSVAEGLSARGHELRFLSSAKGAAYLRTHFEGRVHDVFGLCTVYREGKAEPFNTVLQNIRRASTGLLPANRGVKRLFAEYRPDLVITDFEPFAAFAARRFGVPFISLDNQHLLTHCRVDHPTGFWRDLINAYLTIRLYYAGARRYLVTSFIDAPVRYHPTTVVDPVLRPVVYQKSRSDGDFLLAYKGASGRNDGLREELERFEGMPIRAYGFGITGQRGRVTFKPICADEFLEDLAGCAAVISSAGHSLVCEALHLEKPMLLVPISQQYEQIVNAAHVEKMGVGRSVARLSVPQIDEFVSRLDCGIL